MLKRLYIRFLHRKYGVHVRRYNDQYWCMSVGKILNAYTLIELKAKIERMI